MIVNLPDFFVARVVVQLQMLLVLSPVALNLADDVVIEVDLPLALFVTLLVIRLAINLHLWRRLLFCLLLERHKRVNSCERVLILPALHRL
jgi:hypothetical protein